MIYCNSVQILCFIRDSLCVLCLCVPEGWLEHGTHASFVFFYRGPCRYRWCVVRSTYVYRPDAAPQHLLPKVFYVWKKWATHSILGIITMFSVCHVPCNLHASYLMLRVGTYAQFDVYTIGRRCTCSLWYISCVKAGKRQTKHDAAHTEVPAIYTLQNNDKGTYRYIHIFICQ
jgi:hypothetical protein